jgi:L-iditol 2-dehydrogenase
MRAARLHGPGDIRVHDEPDPMPGELEELVLVTAVGLCGSDRHWFVEGGIGDSTLSRPLVLGHEIAGVIETGPRRGQRVAVDPAIPCGLCDLCAADRAHLCRELRFAGHGTTEGGLRTLMAWPRDLLVTVPDSLGDADTALLEPLGVALHATDLGKVEPGMTAGVFGCGPIGLLLIQNLRRLGVVHILATDRIPERLAAASTFGATETRRADELSRGTDAAADPRRSELDVVFEVAGEDGALEDAIEAARPGGRVVLVGIPASDRTSFPAHVARRKGLTLLMSRRMRASDLPRAVELAARGKIDVRSLVSTRRSLDQVGDAFGRLTHYDGLKVVVEPQS